MTIDRNMAKITTLLCLILFVFSSIVAHAARMNPGLAAVGSQRKVGLFFSGVDQAEVGDEDCKGISEEDCLIRRTLAAHVDYIYTQKHNKRP